jgi:multidrug efflux pump subunit AcrA (membrane-fusion protein)
MSEKVNYYRAGVLTRTLVVLLVAASIVACSRQGRTTTPVRKDIVDAVFATGHLAMSDEYVVATNQEGYLAYVFVKPGDRVEVGDSLFRLASPVKSSELATARAQYQEALRKAGPNSPSIVSIRLQIEHATKQLDIEERNLNRYGVLVKSSAASQLDYDNAKLRFESAKSNLSILNQTLTDLQDELALNVGIAENQLRIVESQQDDHLIKAAKAGRVLEVYKEAGELARRGESLAQIGGGDFLARLFVAEEDVHLLRIGQVTKIGLNTNKERVFDGTITAIYPSFDGANQSFKLEASFDKDGAMLFPGTQLQANIILSIREKVLTIPLEYLLDNNHVILEGGEVVAVTTGVRSGGWVEVTSGISDASRLQERR